MNLSTSHIGKWVAAKSNKVVASDKTLTKLMKKTSTRKDSASLKYALIPKGYMAG